MSLEVTSLRAIAHPVRLRMLSLLTGVEMSAADVARELDISQANASYHMRVLAASGFLQESGTTSIRGGIAKLYTHPWEQGPSQSQAAPDHRVGSRFLVQAVADELVRRNDSRSPDGPQTTNDAELWVEPEVWAEVVDLVLQASTRLHGSARLPRSPGTVHVNMTAVLFELADHPAAAKREPEEYPA